MFRLTIWPSSEVENTKMRYIKCVKRNCEGTKYVHQCKGVITQEFQLAVHLPREIFVLWIVR